MPVFDLIPAYWLQQGLNALALACLYVTLASAYALLQGITNRIILSFGDFATYGSFAAVYAALWTLLSGNEGVAVMAVALVAAMATAAALGSASHALVFAPIMRAPSQAVMIASIGLSIVLQEVMRLQSGARDQWLSPLFGNGIDLVGGAFPVQIGYTQIAVIAAAASALAALLLGMRYSAAGRLWRATAQNPLLAQLSGVNTRAVFQWSFVMASLLASISGWIVAVAYGGVSFSMGLVLGFKAMFAAIIGGFGTIGGAIAGGIFLAALETAWTASMPMAYRDVAAFGIIILILVLKPEGLLGSPYRRESEA
ncbi:MAG: branched-chain amino acid ABC transporter permease [Rhizobiales bacterium]|nr:branched-chain amino acid ABC transporter permease [Hyphomicrobiales bacterium]